MEFVDLTGRHTIVVEGAPPTRKLDGGPDDGEFTQFDGAGCLKVLGNTDDFKYGLGPVCIELIAYVYSTQDLYDPTDTSGRITDGGTAWHGPTVLSINGYRNVQSLQYSYAPWALSIYENSWIKLRYDIVGGLCRTYINGVFRDENPAWNVTNLAYDQLVIAGWNGYPYYTKCKLAGLRITRASRSGMPFDLGAIGSDDPLWASTVLLIRFDGEVPTSKTTITSISDVTSTGAGWATENGAGPKTITGSISAPLASGETVSVSLDAGATWSVATVSGTTWTFTDTTDHATSWYVFSRVVAANGLSGETSTVQITLVPPVEKLPNPYPPRITSEHAVRPRFMSMVDMLTQHIWDATQAANALPSQFDLDNAVGAQLDIIGEWVGQGRALRVPIPSVWFSFDTAGLGFDQGVWKGPYDATTGLTLLPDEPYRLLLRARIATNSWDGTRKSAVDAWAVMFDGTGVTFKIQDNGDMTMEVLIYTDHPLDAITKALVTGGYLGIKPAGVEITNYTIIEV